MRNLLILVAVSLVLGLALVVTSFRQEASTPAPDSTTSVDSASSSNSVANTQTRTDHIENEHYVFERLVPAEVVPGQQYTITVRFEAKQNLSVLAYSEEENSDWALVSGQLQNIRTGMTPGESFEDQYVVLITTSDATITLTGAARVPVDEGDGRLILESVIDVVQ